MYRVMKLLNRVKTVSGKSFFDYSSEEKKKIIKRAAIGASEAQLALVKEYERKYHNR